MSENKETPSEAERIQKASDDHHRWLERRGGEMNFLTELTRQLRGWLDETIYITRANVAEMLATAAGAAVSEPARITLHREVDPDSAVWHILVIDGEREVLLDANDVATLRAVLVCYDENDGPRIGDPLTEPMKLEDGRVVVRWQG